MLTFPELIKKIREEAGLTQAEFAVAVDVSPVLIAMIESEQKEVSKKLIIKIAKKMNVHPASITPFLFVKENDPIKGISTIEQSLIKWGEKMQTLLIKDRSKLLRSYAK
ncbi:MAG: helix-turn-helix transcriptional regulator [bacterium]|nr:helix-turn-helix transcriptional regulator [bacterium]